MRAGEQSRELPGRRDPDRFALPRPYAFVAKRELREQLVAGRYLRQLGARSPVERFDLKSSVEDANRMADAVARGRSLLVFPEGTSVA